MRLTSLTVRILSLIALALATIAVCVLVLANIQLTHIVDESQAAVYGEKVDTILERLRRTNERLGQTGLVEAYARDFKDSVIQSLRQTYYRRAGQEIYPFIIGGGGDVVMHPVLPAGDRSLVGSRVVEGMLGAAEGNFTYAYQGADKWCLFKRFPEWNWVVGYTVPLEVKYADVRRFRDRLMYIMAAISLLVLGVLSAVVARFTRPISRLTTVAEAMAGGDLDQRIEQTGSDEVGTLGRSFARMRDAIRQTIVMLRESEALHRSLVENINLGIALVDREHTIVMANAAQGRLFGRPSAWFPGKKCFQAFERNDYVCPHCPGEIAMSTGAPGETTALGRRADGTTFTMSIRAFPLVGEEGENRGFIEVVEDITQKLKVQEELADEKERLAVTLRSIGDGVITTDTAGKVVMLNEVAERLTGWSSDEAAGHPLEDVFPIFDEQSGERCESPAARVVASRQVVGLAANTVLVGRGGARVAIADSGAPILDREGAIIGVVLVFRDVTERVRTDRELLKLRQLESLGVLAGGIAHDFNNILTAVSGNISLALLDSGLTEKAKGLLGAAEKASLMAKDLTLQLLTFSRGGTRSRRRHPSRA